MNYSDLDALTKGQTRSGLSEGGTSELPIAKVYPNPEQPRKHFPTEQIEELAASIARDGLLQPITVVRNEIDGTYMIVAGERRYRAHLWNNAETIKAHIIVVDDDRVDELALIENIQRADLTDFEVAVHISKLWASGRYERKQDLAASIGKSSSYLSKAFGCLKLDQEITADLEEARRDIPLSVLEELSRVKDKSAQRDAYGKYLDGEITRDDIKTFKPDRKPEPGNKELEGETEENPDVKEQTETEPERIAPWIIADSFDNPDGLDFTKIIDLSNALGLFTPKRFHDDNAVTKHFKITIEEL
jgi:ParB family chromosome partitioning protein